MRLSILRKAYRSPCFLYHLWTLSVTPAFWHIFLYLKKQVFLYHVLSVLYDIDYLSLHKIPQAVRKTIQNIFFRCFHTDLTKAKKSLLRLRPCHILYAEKTLRILFFSRLCLGCHIIHGYFHRLTAELCQMNRVLH